MTAALMQTLKLIALKLTGELAGTSGRNVIVDSKRVQNSTRPRAVVAAIGNHVFSLKLLVRIMFHHIKQLVCISGFLLEKLLIHDQTVLLFHDIEFVPEFHFRVAFSAYNHLGAVVVEGEDFLVRRNFLFADDPGLSLF